MSVTMQHNSYALFYCFAFLPYHLIIALFTVFPFYFFTFKLPFLVLL